MVGIRGAEDITLDYNFFKGLIRRICTMVVNNYRLMESGSGSSRYAKRVVEYMLTRHCAGGSRQHIIYDCHGNVIPCSFMPESMGLSSGTGGEPSERFDHVYSAVNHLFQSGLADRLKGKCGDCEYKSSCLGGCITMKIPSALSVEDEQPICMYRLIREVCEEFSEKERELLYLYWSSCFLKKSGGEDSDRVCVRRLPVWELNYRYDMNRESNKFTI